MPFQTLVSNQRVRQWYNRLLAGLMPFQTLVSNRRVRQWYNRLKPV
jgi:hypothetical protein